MSPTATTVVMDPISVNATYFHGLLPPSTMQSKIDFFLNSSMSAIVFWFCSRYTPACIIKPTMDLYLLKFVKVTVVIAFKGHFFQISWICDTKKTNLHLLSQLFS